MDEPFRERLLLDVNKGVNIFIIIEDGVVQDQYGQWLDVLEHGKSFVTNNGIRIYELSSFVKGRAFVKAEYNSRL